MTGVPGYRVSDRLRVSFWLALRALSRDAAVALDLESAGAFRKEFLALGGEVATTQSILRAS